MRAAPERAEAEQQRVAATGGRQVVLGGPGTGKTMAVVTWSACRAVPTGAGPVVLVPGRRSADRVRDLLEARLTGTLSQPVARTPHSLAWSVLREHALREGRRPPRLVTASERDELIAELLLGHDADADGAPDTGGWAHNDGWADADGSGDTIGSVPTWPPHLDRRLRLSRTFRDELRELSARLVEHRAGPDDLRRLARRHGRPEWAAAAQVVLEAEQVAGLRGDEAHDPASIVTVAAGLLADASTGLAEWLASQVRHLAVDDAQDLTPAGWALVREAADVVGDVLVVGDPDAATQTFRGGHPELLLAAADTLAGPGRAVTRTVLRQPLRQPGLLQHVTAAVGAELHGPGGAPWAATAAGPAGSATPAPDEGVPSGWTHPDGAAGLLVCLDRADEAAVVAGELRHRHDRAEDPVAWRDMAVVVRSVRASDELRRALHASGVPVRVPGVRAPLREEPVVGLLLALLDVVADPQLLDPELLERLVTGPVGGGDPVRWRRLSQQARSAARQRSGGAVATRDAVLGLCDAVRDVLKRVTPPPRAGESFAGLPPAVAGPLVRATEVLLAGARARDDGVEAVLWAVWDTMRVAERWRRTALGAGADAARADADLDAVTGLFAAAAGWVEANPLGGPDDFVAHVRSRSVGDDRLGPDGSADSVTVTTPAGAVGMQWRTVVVAGVQDGVWPNPRLRGSLLGLPDLVTVLRGGRPAAPGRSEEHAELRRQARREVVREELRLFHVAVSRASHELIVTAADDASSRPSDLCTLLERAVPAERLQRRPSASPSVLSVPEPLPAGTVPPAATVPPDQVGARGAGVVAGQSLSEATASLRRVLDDPATTSARRDAAAALLARLATAGVRGADPADWGWVHGPSTRSPRDPAGVTVSPSSVERFLRCPLQWYLTASGGRAPRETSQGVGTLVHAALEQVPDGDLPRLRAVVDAGWADLELGDGWVSRHERRRVEEMLAKISVWVGEQRSAGVEVVAREATFAYEVDGTPVRGTVDRVERTPDGGLRVVDLKTGRSAASAAETAENPQLQLYQLGVARQAVADLQGPPAGALLLHVGTTHKSAAERSQARLDETGLAAVEQRVREVGAGMRAGSFEARQSRDCDRCPVRPSCPTTPEGRRVAPREQGVDGA